MNCLTNSPIFFSFPDGAQGGPNQDTLVTPKRAKKTQEQDDGNVQTNDKSLDEHDLDLDDEGGTYVGEVYIPPIAPVCFADPTGPRLIITKIVAFNFKSYAGYVTLGPFNTVSKFPAVPTFFNIIFYFHLYFY